MRLYRLIIAGLWLLFVVYWAIAAVGMKRGARGQSRRGGVGIRLAVVVVIVVLLQFPQLRQVLAQAQRFVAHAAILGPIGLALCVLGFGLAFSARFYLGRNWGPPMSQRQEPELVTRGPYGVIRHPIYTGVILAMLGSAMAESVVWVPILLLFGGYFVHSARKEEALMLRLFPEQYPNYRARTGMLVPRPFRRH